MNREERKKECLKCFIHTFSENGIDRTPIKKLAIAAKMNEASIYQYFTNKDEIVVDCVQFYLEGELNRLLQILLDSEEKLETKVKRFIQLSSETSKESKFVIQVLTSPVYGKMCASMVHNFIQRLPSSRKMNSESGEYKNYMDKPIIELLFLSVVISDRVINEENIFCEQIEYLLRIFCSDDLLERAERSTA